MIRIGVGGWTYPPWRGLFYPEGLRQADELAFAAGKLTSIEINGTFYRTQTPASFRKWAAETPNDFVFSLKGPRYAVNRSDLGEAGPSVERFVESGILELGAKLGPLLWQLPPTKRFDADEIARFVDLLPRDAEGRRLRHVLEVRHASFLDPAFVALAQRLAIPVVYADSDGYPAIADPSGDFVYARLMRSRSPEPAGYAPADLDRWAERIRRWAAGEAPDDLPRVVPADVRDSPQATAVEGGGGASKRSREVAPVPPARDCFVYVISGSKERAPAAAMALIERLG